MSGVRFKLIKARVDKSILPPTNSIEQADRNTAIRELEKNALSDLMWAVGELTDAVNLLEYQHDGDCVTCKPGNLCEVARMLETYKGVILDD